MPMARPIKQASCLFCKEKFDRNRVPFIPVHARPNYARYIHASCATAYAAKTKEVLGKTIDPSKEYMCEFCHLPIPKGQEITLSGDRYAHATCVASDKTIEKTDSEKLYQYISKLYDESFVDPAKQKAIQKMIDSFGFTHSGIHGTLVYIYEILQKSPQDSNYLGIVPYYYLQAKEYYMEKARVKAENAKIDIENYKPEIKIVKATERLREPMKKIRISILDEEIIDGE